MTSASALAFGGMVSGVLSIVGGVVSSWRPTAGAPLIALGAAVMLAVNVYVLARDKGTA